MIFLATKNHRKLNHGTKYNHSWKNWCYRELIVKIIFKICLVWWIVVGIQNHYYIFKKYIIQPHSIKIMIFFYLLMEMFAYFPTRWCNWFIILMISHCNISVYTFYGNKRYMLLKPQNFTFFKWKSITYNQPHTFWVFFYTILVHQVKRIALWRNVATSSKSTKCGLLATSHHIFWKKNLIGNIQYIS